MNKGYAAYCDADRWLYDAPYRRAGESYPAALAPVPQGWRSHRSGDWLALRPAGAELPAQGWKLEGKPLNTYFARRHPLIEADPAPAELAAYTAWALKIHQRVTEAVDAVHARGVVFNDLHLFNIMVAEDDTGEPSVALLDFEAAAHIDEGLRQTVANPAFVAPAERRGFAVDRYALACLRLALFLPLTSLLVMDRAKAAHLAAVAAEQFPVPRRFLDEAVEEILSGVPEGRPGHRLPAPAGPYLPVEPGAWPAARTSMAAAVRASATPHREDRFVPGDIAQFTTAHGGIGFGHGIAGVLHALAETGAGPWPEAEEWLLDRTADPASGTPLGFYDGLAGTAWTLDRLLRRDPSGSAWTVLCAAVITAEVVLDAAAVRPAGCRWSRCSPTASPPERWPAASRTSCRHCCRPSTH
ncbi:hypothetical protein [Streptomyces yangpuensis]|uniref:class III lanthionine synthetase LanKC N-terminal domain-containing protein n=1 Tax=Streptomyces yangpuensis TaxID=1648182 RepID=UPI0036654F1B